MNPNPSGSAPGAEQDPTPVARPVVKKGAGRARRPDLDTLMSVNADGSRTSLNLETPSLNSLVYNYVTCA